MPREKLAIIVFGAGAVLSAAWAVADIRGVLRMLNEGGGLGTAGAFDALEYVVPFIVTLWLSVRMRKRGVGRGVRRAYRLTIFAMLVSFGLLLTEPVFHTHIFGNGLVDWTIFVAAFVAGALWLPVQTFFAAAFLSLIIRQPASAS